MKFSRFEKIPESISGTEQHKKIVEALELQKPELNEFVKNLEIVLENGKNLIRESKYLEENEIKEFFEATDKLTEAFREIVDLALSDIKKYNEYVEKYDFYREIVEYWDAEYDRRESKFKINGVRSNSIH